MHITSGVGLRADATNTFREIDVLTITSTFKRFFDPPMDVTDSGCDVDDDFSVDGEGEVFGFFECGVLGTDGDGHGCGCFGHCRSTT